MASFLFLIVSDEWIKLCTILETRAKDQEGWTTRGRFALGGLSRNQSQVEPLKRFVQRIKYSNHSMSF